MKIIVNIMMLFALFIVQAHDIIEHEHYHLLETANAKGIFHDEETAHFELSDIFSNFNHPGNHLVFSKAANEFSRRFKVLKAEQILHYSYTDVVPHTKPIRHCIRDNPDLYNSEVSFLFSLRAPPLLIS